MEKPYYVYVYLRADRQSPYYVGKGKGKRAYHKGVRSTPKPPTRDRIIKIKEHLTEGDALDLERTLIRFWGRIDNGTGVLRNHTDGGEGASSYTWDKDALKKRAAKQAKNWKERHGVQWTITKDGHTWTEKNTLRGLCRDYGVNRKRIQDGEPSKGYVIKQN